ncbi:MAG TPA: Na+/H+ antiporter NhaA [Gemmatimonadales bacterium]
MARSPVVLPDSPLIERVLWPFQQFAHRESAGGVVLLVTTVVALVWANSPWAESYHYVWERTFTVGAPGFGLSLSLHHWINDGLMAVFFFVVGLEIKRELLVGELSTRRGAAFPIAGAVGGMVVPAAIYAAINAGGPGAAGWGIPMATDIAFALGVLALLGPRVPLALKVFLAALAIVDDIGAVLVIALFYTADLSLGALAWAGGALVLLVLANLSGVRHPAVYAVVGLVLWVAVLYSGIHATIAGVLLAMTIPARTRLDPDQFLERAQAALDDFERGSGGHTTVLTNEEQQEALQRLEELCEAAQAPLLKLEDKLHAVVAFGIMPLFALANAGVPLSRDVAGVLGEPISLGIILGLLLGKPLGITAAAWLAVRSGLAAKPANVPWPAVHATGWLAGIGFTMSIFIAGLAFPSAAELTAAKLGVLAASLAAGLVGWALMRKATAGLAAEAA